MNPEKQKVRFNFVDALIILIILAVVGAAVYLIVSGAGEGKPREGGAKLTFTVRISEVDAEYLPLIRENETVKNSSTGKVVGTIASVRTEKARHFGKTAIPDGKGGYTVATTAYEDKYDVYVTISAYAETANLVLKEGGMQYDRIYRAGDVRLLVGARLNFKVPSFAKEAYVVEGPLAYVAVID